MLDCFLVNFPLRYCHHGGYLVYNNTANDFCYFIYLTDWLTLTRVASARFLIGARMETLGSYSGPLYQKDRAVFSRLFAKFRWVSLKVDNLKIEKATRTF